MEQLKNLASKTLIEHIAVSNVLKLAAYADRFNAEELKKVCGGSLC